LHLLLDQWLKPALYIAHAELPEQLAAVTDCGRKRLRMEQIADGVGARESIGLGDRHRTGMCSRILPAGAIFRGSAMKTAAAPKGVTARLVSLRTKPSSGRNA
jgi:hypothetical protein